MTDEIPIPPQPEGAPDGVQQQFSVLLQYMKDLSIENPNAPKVFQWRSQPKVELQFEVAIEPMENDVYEVALKIQANVKSDEGQHYLVDLTYAGLFGIRGFPPEQLDPLLKIEAPRMIFPFARQTVMNASSDCGFPPLMLEPIDFAAHYMANLQKVAQDQAQAAPNGAAAVQADAPAASDVDAKA